MHVNGPISPAEALAIYLQDHHAGAAGGVALARRAAANQRGTRAGRVLAELADEIAEDERVLLRVMEHVGAEPSAVKDLGAKAAERVGRLKTNGQLLGTSPLSPVIEMEGLLTGIKSKQHLWTLLRDATDLDIDGVDPDRMLGRAERQIERLQGLWRDAAAAAFPGRERASTA